MGGLVSKALSKSNQIGSLRAEVLKKKFQYDQIISGLDNKQIISGKIISDYKPG